MKLIKNIIDKQFNNPDLILSWLYWLEDHCSRTNCDDCLYWKDFKGEMDCEILHVYKKVSPDPYSYVFPSHWCLLGPSIEKTQPPNLDFLTKIRWSEYGFPDIRRSKNEIIEGID